MRELNQDADRKTRFSEIADDLIQRIRAGGFPVGSLLPTELELCEQYGTSRHTVRAALAVLQDQGLLSRKKNVGTRVESDRPRPQFRPALSSIADLVQFGEKHLRQVQVVRDVVTDPGLAADIDCQVGKRWLCVSSLRVEQGQDGKPTGWTDVYVDPRFAGIGDLARARPEALISNLLDEQYAISTAELRQEIRAVLLQDAAMAQVLGCDPGTPALKVVRRYLDAHGDLFEASVSIHPADRFSVSMHMRRN